MPYDPIEGKANYVAEIVNSISDFIKQRKAGADTPLIIQSNSISTASHRIRLDFISVN